MGLIESGSFSSTFKKIKIDDKDLIDDIIRQRFYNSLNKWVSNIYLYTIDNKIISFCMLMKENLKLGFLHYHVPVQDKKYFIKHYPILDKKTNQIHYIYTSKSYRTQNIASELLNFIFDDLKKRDYKFVWLIDETKSTIYDKFNFLNFSNILKQLNIKESFLKDYYLKCHCIESKLIDYYGDRRVAKEL